MNDHRIFEVRESSNSKRKKSAAEQLEESKIFYVKTSSVRSKRQELRSLKLYPEQNLKKTDETASCRKCFQQSADMRPRSVICANASSEETKVNTREKTTPPVSQRTKELSFSSAASSHNSQTTVFENSGFPVNKTTPVPKPPRETEHNFHADMMKCLEGQKISTMEKLLKVLAVPCSRNPASSDAQKNKRETADDFKERLIALLTNSDCENLPANLSSGVPDSRRGIKRSKSLNRCSPDSMKEGWSLYSGNAALSVAPFEINQNGETKVHSHLTSPLGRRQKSLPGLSSVSIGNETNSKNFQEDCSTVEAHIDSTSETSFFLYDQPNKFAPPPISLISEPRTCDKSQWKLHSFFDTMGLDSEIMKTLTCRDEVDSVQVVGSVTSPPSTFNYSISQMDNESMQNNGQNNSRKPISIIEKNARVIRWIYGCDKMK